MIFKFNFYGKTDKGKLRELNEDNFVIEKEFNLIAVADGMGGHNAGDVASKMCLDVLVSEFKKLKNEKSGNFLKTGLSENSSLLLEAAIKSNNAVFKESLKYPKGMGTTLTAILFNYDKFSMLHIGDSRAYIYDKTNHTLKQLSEDDSWVYKQYKEGLISYEEMQTNPYRNVLLKALGTRPDVKFSVKEYPLKENTVILLCSDGLNKMLSDTEILEVLNSKPNIEKAANDLVRLSNEKGGEDNITVVLAEVLKND